MIELKQVSRTYHLKKAPSVKALDQVNLLMGDTGMVFILGKSGSGKSTFLNVVGGLDKYDQGEIIIQGKSTKAFKQSDFDSYRNTMIGFIFQEYNILDEFTVAQNIGLALELQGQKATSEKINAILDAVDLRGYGSRKPNELSGGQKQRVAIARALVKDPKIIMADEPTGALDSETGKQVLDTLKKLSSTRLVIVVSHDKEFAEKYASRIVEFQDGKIIKDVTKNADISNPSDPLRFIDNTIAIEPGYQLTQEDVIVINAYLARTKKTSHVVHQDANKRHKQALTFETTNAQDIRLSQQPYTPIRSKLPFHVGLKMGASALRHKKIRLVFSILLAAIAFAMFGLTDVLGSYNKYETTVRSMQDSQIDFLAFTTYIKRDDDYYYKRDTPLTQSNLTYLNSLLPSVQFYPLIGGEGGVQYSRFTYESIIGPRTPQNNFQRYIPSASGLMLLDDVINHFDVSYVGQSLQEPLMDNEIVITRYQYEVIKNFGLRDSNRNVVEVDSVNDVIGKPLVVEFDTFIIKGVIDTSFSTTRFEKIDDKATSDLEKWVLTSELHNTIGYSHHNAFFVSQRTFDRFKVGRFDVEGYASLKYGSFEEYTNRKFKIEDTLPDAHFMQHVDAQSLQPTDILLNYTSMRRVVETLDYSAYLQFMSKNLYDLYLPKEEVRAYLIEYIHGNNEAAIPLVSEWTELEAESVAYTYYHNVLWSDQERINRATLKAYVQTLDHMDMIMHFEAYDALGETIVSQYPVRIVGYFDNKYISSNYSSDIAISEDLAQSLNASYRGYYAAAVAPINQIPDRQLYTYAKLHFDGTETQGFNLRNAVTSTLDDVNGMIESMAKFFFYFGIGFAVFAGLMLLNFISTSVAYKKQEIGILRAIGARGVDVLSIFSKEAIIIALINYVIAMIMVVIVTSLLNNVLRQDYGVLITLLNLSIRQFLLVLLVSVGVAVLSAAIPVIKIAKKRPIDAIRDK